MMGSPMVLIFILPVVLLELLTGDYDWGQAFAGAIENLFTPETQADFKMVMESVLEDLIEAFSMLF